MRSPTETLGALAGWLVAPVFGAASLARRGRAVHTSGDLYEGHVELEALEGELADLGARVRGPALVRFSSAFFRSRHGRPDLLGCAIRVRRDVVPSADASPGDQDLLFGTLRSVWTLPIALFTTEHDDYLANDYYAVSPFDVDGIGPAFLRLRPDAVDTRGADRSERLRDAVHRGSAVLHLELSRDPHGPYTSFARVRLDKAADVDGEAIRFRPVRDGRGIRPRGAMHNLRRGAYVLGQRLRPGRRPGAR